MIRIFCDILDKIIGLILSISKTFEEKSKNANFREFWNDFKNKSSIEKAKNFIQTSSLLGKNTNTLPLPLRQVYGYSF